MKIIDINSMKSPDGQAATLHGFEHRVNVSFFIVQFGPFSGPNKHRHSYEETFIIFDGEIEAVVNGETQRIGRDTIAIIPANTWHEFKNCSDKQLQMVNIHPVLKMITEWA